MCICRDNLSWKKLKHSGAEKMNWGWEWRLLKSKSFFCLPFMFIKGGYTPSLWSMVDKECYCVCMMIGLVKFMRRRSRPRTSCWGGENWHWRRWRRHTINGWRMNFPGIFIMNKVSFVMFISAKPELVRVGTMERQTKTSLVSFTLLMSNLKEVWWAAR